jgi:hypothetical protein
MSDVFYLRPIDPPATPEAVLDMARQSGGCFTLHKVDWEHSYLATDGARMLCWYRAPDAEAARNALKQLGSDMNAVWAGSVHDAAGALADANVAVERSFDEPVTFEAIQALEDSGAACLENHHVRFVRSFFSADRKRMVCLYHAPDAESVRLAQRQADMPVDRVWAFQSIDPRA